MDEKIRSFQVAVLTVSDSRNEENDSSGSYLARQVLEAGHVLQERRICPDDVYAIRSLVSQWIADDTKIVLITGGTGLFARDVTPEAVRALFDKEIEGFGELFRSLSYQEIGSSTIQSRVVAGIANQTLIFALPGSTHACKTGWGIISEQIDGSRRCSFINVLTQKEKIS